jgi:hypothetical protein
MSKNWRRFEVTVPLQFNDGRAVPLEWIGRATREVALQFGGAAFETQKVIGFWFHGGKWYRDNSMRIVVDFPDTAKNRAWMKEFKARLKEQFQQLEIWMVSYRIEIE